MGVMRGGKDNISQMLSCITISLRLRTVTHMPVEPTGLYIHCAPLLSVIHRPHYLTGSAVPECFIFDQYYIIIIMLYMI
jgi:hypothetical protein